MNTFTIPISLPWLKYLAAPVICSFIGWLTNFLAIRMLFHPREPVSILGWKWQGLFPKRQKDLALKLGRLVEEELVNHEDIKRILKDSDFYFRLRELVHEYVLEFIEKKLKAVHPLLFGLLQGPVLERISDLIVKEVESFIPDMLERAAEELEQRVQFSYIVQEKIEKFSMHKLEEIIFAIMKKELWFIELLGGVLGFVIGVFQSGLIYFF